jgi:GT2 family glycosyltransferase
MPELSIFITTFNRSLVLADTLTRLVTMLGGRDVEILVFDDASNDDTPEVCGRFAPRVRTIRSLVNVGYIRARNLGVRETSAELILFLDDDSYILDPIAVDRIRTLFDGNPHAAVLASNIATRAQPTGLDDPQALPYDSGSYIGCGHVLRRSALPSQEPYGPFLSTYGYEETALSLQLLDAGWSVVFDPSVRVYHAEDPSQRPSVRRMASQFTNEISTMVAICPAYLWLPLALKKLTSHWRANWKRDAREVFRAVGASLPSAVGLAMRERRPVRLRTLREFARRRASANARSARWRAAHSGASSSLWWVQRAAAETHEGTAG